MDVKHENNGHELRLYYTYTEAYRLAQLAERASNFAVLAVQVRYR